MTSKSTVDWLNKIRSLTLGATNADHNTAAVIQKFIARTPSASYDGYMGLQKELIVALKSIKYHYTCLARKQNAISTLVDECRQGLKSFQHLYKNAVTKHHLNTADCVVKGVPYTNAARVLEILKKLANHQGWYDNCLLNNKDLLYRVCSERIKGMVK